MGREHDFINIDNLFQKKVNDHNTSHKEEVWQQIEEALDKKKKRRALLPWSNSTIMVLGSVLLGSGMIATYIHLNKGPQTADYIQQPITAVKNNNIQANSTNNIPTKVNNRKQSSNQNISKKSEHSTLITNSVSKTSTNELTISKSADKKLFASNSINKVNRINVVEHGNQPNNTLTKSIHSTKSLGNVIIDSTKQLIHSESVAMNYKNDDENIAIAANSKNSNRNLIENLVKTPDFKTNEESTAENSIISEKVATNPIVKVKDKEYEKVENEWYARVNDSIKRTIIHEYYTTNDQHKRIFVKSDTSVSFELIAKLAPLTAWESNEIDKLFNHNTLLEKPILVASSNNSVLLKEIKTKNTGLEDLDHYKVSSRSDQNAAHGILKFMQNIEKDILSLNEGETKLYFGLNAGINAAISSNANLGYQVGFNVGYKINERLSVMAQFNWIRRSFRNYSVKDLYTEYTNASQTEAGNGSYKYEADVTQNTILISPSSNNIVFVPIELSYNLSPKLSIYGGLGPAFGFSLKQTVKQTSETSHVSQIGVTNPFTSGQSTMLPNNNSNKLFGLGYSVGVNYDLNQKWSLNANLQQFFLSGKSTNAYLTESKSLWKQPMVNVGIGCYLGRTQKVVYMMDK